MRKRFIAGNWKMFNGPTATSEFMVNFVPKLISSKDIAENIKSKKMEVAIFAPFVSLSAAVKARDRKSVV